MYPEITRYLLNLYRIMIQLETIDCYYGETKMKTKSFEKYLEKRMSKEKIAELKKKAHREAEILRSFQRMKLTPRDYQVDAINSIVNCFKDHTRATAVMACATGKTLVALWVAETLQAKTILVLMPSLMLIKQTIDVWMAENKWYSYKFMVICCDNTLLEDDIQLETKDCCFDICTNQEQINRFATSEFDGVKIIFSTYTSSSVIPPTIQFDLSIFDEAHKTAHKDADCFGYALHDKNVHSKKRLFITATPRHYRLRKSQEKLEYSMDNEKVYGPICYRLSFSDAIRLGIICDYKIIITLMDKSKLDDYNLDNKLIKHKNKQVSLKTAAHAISLLQVYNDTKITRSMTFHESINDAKLFTSLASYMFASKKNKPKCLHINGTMNSFERTIIMNDFEQTKHSTISNARCLSEGVDIPTVDLVAFMAPKRSTIDIIQAIGRVMRKAPGKEYGYVFLPLYIDNQKDADQLTSNPEYSYVIDIINSLREYDPELQQTINDILFGRSNEQTNTQKKIAFINTNITQDDLIKSIKITVLDNFIDTWEENFNRLKNFYEKHNHFNMPKEEPGVTKPLAAWARAQRYHIRKNELSADHKAKLQSINFPMDPIGGRWNERFAKLHTYSSEELKQLYRVSRAMDLWLYKQKLNLANGILKGINAERLIKFLKDNDCRLTVDKIKNSYDRNVQLALEYYQKNKSWKTLYKDDQRLYNWLHRNRTNRNFTDEQLRILKELNAPNATDTRSRSNENKWEKKYHEAARFKRKYGTLIFPYRTKHKYKELHGWIIRQRGLMKSGELPPHRLIKLKKLGLKINAWHKKGTKW